LFFFFFFLSMVSAYPSTEADKPEIFSDLAHFIPKNSSLKTFLNKFV